MEKVKCMTCGHIQERDLNVCQKCNASIDGDNRSEDLQKKTKNEIRLASPLSNQQEQFIKGFSFGGLTAGFGGIIFVLIYDSKSRRMDDMEEWEWLSFIPIANLYVAWMLGIEGRLLSWQKGRWASYEEFANTHKDLDVIIPVISLLLILVAIMNCL